MVGIEFVARSFGNAETSQLQDSLWKFRPVHQEKGITKWLSDRSEERRVGKECRSRWSP